MFSIFKPTTSAYQRQLVERLESKIESARAEEAEASRAVAAATLAVEEGDAAAPEELKKARKRLEAAKKTIAETSPAVEIARGRLADAEAIERGQTAQERWEQVIALGQSRIALAADIENDVRALHEKYGELVRLGEQMTEQAPVDIRGGNWNPLSAGFVADYFRAGMLKITGWRWVLNYPLPVEQAPTLLDKIREGNEFLLSKRGTQ